MSNIQNDEDSLRTVLIALVVAAITIAVFLFPAPPAQAPQVELTPEIHITETASAMEVVEVQPTPSRFDDLADAIIHCESSGRNVEIIDSNGEWSRGIAQFQDKTWAWMSDKAGVTGSPLDPEKARQVLLWALENGHGSHWTCYRKVTR